MGSVAIGAVPPLQSPWPLVGGALAKPAVGAPADWSIALRDAGGNAHSWEAGEHRAQLAGCRGVTALLLGTTCGGQVLRPARWGLQSCGHGSHQTKWEGYLLCAFSQEAGSQGRLCDEEGSGTHARASEGPKLPWGREEQRGARRDSACVQGARSTDHV